jgi:non-specific serine/threonine protein kinase
LIGRTLSHFRITAKIGEGGMGEVYRAEDTKLGRDVALKVLPAELAGSQERLERFQREARTLAALDHPNIVTIHSVEEAEGVHFLTMQLVDGKPLSEVIPEGGMPVEQILEVATPLADALAAAHEKGVIHRDLKPGNIMVGADGRVRVLDFGLAKAGQAPGEDAHTQMATEPLTAEGRVLGTMAYMSPEQLAGKNLDARSDIFSLGVVLYQMATGRRPFEGDTPVSTITAILHETPPSVSSIRDSLPSSLDSVIARCLEKDPGGRYQSAEELGASLSKGQGTDRDIFRPSRLQAGLGGLAILMVMIAIFAQWRADNEAPPTLETIVTDSQQRRPSIAVLPFTNVSGEPEQSYFSNGLTEELITELSKFQELSVVALASTLPYADGAVDVREIGQELGVRYVLRGSVQKAGETIRMTVELSDASDGKRLWGESYDRSLTASDVFSLQDELTLAVVSEIANSYGALFQAEFEQTRRKPPTSLNSYDCILRVYDYLQIHSSEKHRAARDCMESAVAADPDYVEAIAWMGYLYGEEFHHRYNERPNEYDALERALELGEKAARLDTVSQVTHGTLAMTLFARRESERAFIEARRAVDLNPRNALWLALLGLYTAQGGDVETGMPLVREAILLTPHPPTWVHMAFFYDHYMAGRYEEALASARLTNWDGDFRVPLFEAAALGQLGRVQEATSSLEELRRLWPRPNADLFDELVVRHAIAPSFVEALMAGLAKAGLEGLPDDPGARSE